MSKKDEERNAREGDADEDDAVRADEETKAEERADEETKADEQPEGDEAAGGDADGDEEHAVRADEETEDKERADEETEDKEQASGDVVPVPATGPAVDPPLSTKADAHEDAPTQLTDQETKELLHKLMEQEKRRSSQQMAEAKELRRRAKELEQRAKQRARFKRDMARHAEVVQQMAPQLGLDPDRPVTDIPPLDDSNLEEVEFTTVQEDRSYIRVVYDRATSRYFYQIIEPQLTETEQEVLEFLHDTLVRTLDGRYGAGEDWEEVLRDATARAIVDHSMLVDDVSRARLEYYLVRDFLGYGPVDVMMRDPMIEDISCDGPGIPLYIFHRQYESMRSNVVFPTEEELDSYVLKLAQRCGKHISVANPILDATLPDTSRLQATLSREVTTRGSSFTIRKFRTDPLTPPDLVRLGTLSPHMAAYFWLAIEEGSSVLFAGGTASGKTTTLNAVCQFIPPAKKIVSIEDTREINLEHENWIAGLTRTGFGGEVVEGKVTGTVDMYELLEAALRQRPEYLLVGEVRGPEALTLFQAMATGHATYSTLHADSVMSAVYRLENPPINVPRTMLQTLDIVAIQLQARVDKRLVRRLKEITEVVEIDPESGDLLTNTVFRWSPSADEFEYLGKSHLFDVIAERHNRTPEKVVQEWEDRSEVVAWMVDKGIRHISDVSNVVSAYFADPEGILRQARRGGSPRTLEVPSLGSGAGRTGGSGGKDHRGHEEAFGDAGRASTSGDAPGDGAGTVEDDGEMEDGDKVEDDGEMEDEGAIAEEAS